MKATATNVKEKYPPRTSTDRSVPRQIGSASTTRPTVSTVVVVGREASAADTAEFRTCLPLRHLPASHDPEAERWLPWRPSIGLPKLILCTAAHAGHLRQLALPADEAGEL